MVKTQALNKGPADKEGTESGELVLRKEYTRGVGDSPQALIKNKGY